MESTVFDTTGTSSSSLPLDHDAIERFFSQSSPHEKKQTDASTSESGTTDDVSMSSDACATQQRETSNTEEARKTSVRLLDVKNSYLAEIILANIRMDTDSLIEAVVEMDVASLTHDIVLQLVQLVPSDEDRARIVAYTGPESALIKVDSFMFRFLARIQRIDAKLVALDFAFTFHQTCADLLYRVNSIEAAANELRASDRFKYLISAVLQLVNTLNIDRRPRAAGIRLESLSKLRDTRSFDQKTSLLHFLISQIEQVDERLLDVIEELPNIEAAAKSLWPDIDSKLVSLRSGHNALNGEMKALSPSAPDSESAPVSSSSLGQGESGACDATRSKSGTDATSSLHSLSSSSRERIADLESRVTAAKEAFSETARFFCEPVLRNGNVDSEEPARLFGKVLDFLQVVHQARTEERAKIEVCKPPPPPSSPAQYEEEATAHERERSPPDADEDSGRDVNHTDTDEHEREIETEHADCAQTCQ